jgi:hypothetical protein
LTVFVPEVCAKVTKLKLTLLQASAAVVEPSNVTVPALALKVVPELKVRAPATVIVPDGALNTELEFRVNAPLISAPLGTVTVELVWTVKLLATVNVVYEPRLEVIPEIISVPARRPLNPDRVPECVN